MSNDIPKRLQELIGAVGGNRQTACWEVRNNVWAVNHKTLEKIAQHLGITFDNPVPLAVGPDFTALCVTGRLGDKSEWSVGEASQATSHNKYYCAMAEKRAKDRVVLKLIGLHGDTYSEDEADDFKDSKPDPLLTHANAVRENLEEIYQIKTALANQDLMTAAQYYADMERDLVETLWKAPSKGGIWSTAEREMMKADGELAKCIKKMKETA